MTTHRDGSRDLSRDVNRDVIGGTEDADEAPTGGGRILAALVAVALVLLAVPTLVEDAGPALGLSGPVVEDRSTSEPRSPLGSPRPSSSALELGVEPPGPAPTTESAIVLTATLEQDVVRRHRPISIPGSGATDGSALTPTIAVPGLERAFSVPGLGVVLGTDAGVRLLPSGSEVVSPVLAPGRLLAVVGERAVTLVDGAPGADGDSADDAGGLLVEVSLIDRTARSAELPPRTGFVPAGAVTSEADGSAVGLLALRRTPPDPRAVSGDLAVYWPGGGRVPASVLRGVSLVGQAPGRLLTTDGGCTKDCQLSVSAVEPRGATTRSLVPPRGWRFVPAGGVVSVSDRFVVHVAMGRFTALAEVDEADGTARLVPGTLGALVSVGLAPGQGSTVLFGVSASDGIRVAVAAPGQGSAVTTVVLSPTETLLGAA